MLTIDVAMRSSIGSFCLPRNRYDDGGNWASFGLEFGRFALISTHD